VSGWLPRHPDAVAPLAGLRVLDLSELLPGPFMTQSLVELGADVLKVERPPHGDPLRRSAPALFVAVNRGKRMLQVDLKSNEGRAHVLALADEADVLVESYRPGVVAGWGWIRPRCIGATQGSWWWHSQATARMVLGRSGPATTSTTWPPPGLLEWP
jgi:crotonobetainyl-CoA:carnitine CoA-transferase CaiB-like acyl-CoA transferase